MPLILAPSQAAISVSCQCKSLDLATPSSSHVDTRALLNPAPPSICCLLAISQSSFFPRQTSSFAEIVKEPTMSSERERFPELFVEGNIDRRKCERVVPMKVLVLGFMRTGSQCAFIL